MAALAIGEGCSLIQTRRIDQVKSSNRDLKGFFAGCCLQLRVHFHPSRIRFSSLSHKVGPGEVDHFVSAPAQYRSNHVKAEAQSLFKADRRRHR